MTVLLHFHPRAVFARVRRAWAGFLGLFDPVDAESADDQELLLGEIGACMNRCWESLRAETLRGGRLDEPRTRRDAILHHFETWLEGKAEYADVLDGWRRAKQETRLMLLDWFADPPPLNIIGFTCDHCGALDPQTYNPYQQECSQCGWVWVRPPVAHVKDENEGPSAKPSAE